MPDGGITFAVPGAAIGKGRPRFSTRGGFVRTFTPQATVNAEALVKTKAEVAMAGRALYDGPVEMEIAIWCTVPASWPKKRRVAGAWVVTRPDLDNIVKMYADALNGVVYRDDKQVARLSVSKLYTLGDPKTVVMVKPLYENAPEAAADRPRPSPVPLLEALAS